ncbi:Transcription termination factor Rho [Brevinematales bacterium NS]|nr:Transcription termination factor Rho [Brevinematales bacterium NS]
MPRKKIVLKVNAEENVSQSPAEASQETPPESQAASLENGGQEGMQGLPETQKPSYKHLLFAKYVPSNNLEDVLKQIFTEDRSIIFLNKLKQLSITELVKVAEYMEIENYEDMHTQELIYQILRKHADKNGIIYGGGTLQIIEKERDNTFGFLRSPRYSYYASSDDIYVSGHQLHNFRLRNGDTIEGHIRPPKKPEEEKFFALMRIEKVNDLSPEEAKRRPLFDNLTPLFPNERLRLETTPNEIAMRIMDLFTPIGKGQRGLIVSPPKAGKTSLLQKIANSITQNHPEVTLIIFLVDERPEEVTEMQRSVKAEVISSTFDEPPQKHIQVANMVLEKAKRLVESGHDVVILLDSITRLARAYNQVEPASGKILSGGIDANTLYKPKKFFGAARNIEEGGSLTILATALIDTGSKMDEVIYEEFKGTGNMEIHLDRNLANMRIFPAIDLKLSGTRREELLLDPVTLERVHMLRRAFAGMSNEDVIEKLSAALRKATTNEEFIQNLQVYANLNGKS